MPAWLPPCNRRDTDTIGNDATDMVAMLTQLGCQVTLSGISASVAITLTQLGIYLQDVATARNPQEALAQHIGSAVAVSDR